MKMEEDFEQSILGGADDDDDDNEWSHPVEVLDPVGTKTQKDLHANHGTEFQKQSGTALLSPKRDHPRTIVHIDLDCFYAQVEMIHNPTLRDVPLGIQQKYLVVTCNYPARARGVTKLMGISEAKKKCPELVLVSGEDLTGYREMSYKISEFLMKYTPCVERLGFDENFLDVTEMVDQRIRGGTAKEDVVGHVYTSQDSDSGQDSSLAKHCPCGCHHRLAVGSQIAADIRSAMSIELGITSCAGVAHNKLLAKLVGSRHKPNQQTTVFPCHGLPLVTGLLTARNIPGIGSATSKRLKALGVETVPDLQRFPLSQLEEEFGVVMATTINHLAFGIDDSPVVTYSRPQMLSIEDSFRRCSSEKDATQRVSQLITNLLPRAQEDGRTPHTVRLTIRKVDRGNRYMQRESRQCNLPSGIAAKISMGQLDVAHNNLVSLVMSLFHKMVDTKQPFHLTLINVAFTKLEETASNCITTFFTSQPTTPVSHDHQHHHSDADSCVSPKSTREKEKRAAENAADNPGSENPKRRHSSSLSHFFTKKQKVKETGGDFTEPAVESIAGCKRLRETQSAEFSHDTRHAVLPADVDPQVFAQLPKEIQQEILQTVPQQSLAETKQMSGSSTLPQNSSVSRHTAMPSTSELIHVDRNPSPVPQEQKTPDRSFFVQTKKSIFSPTKHKAKEAHPVTRPEKLVRQQTCDPCSDCSHADLQMKDVINTEQDSSVSEEKEISKITGLSQQESQDFQTQHPSLEIPDRKFPNSQQNPTPSKSYNANNSQSNANNFQSSHERRCSLIDSIHNPKMSVPKGIAPDVFSALPPELQREVAAEMAIRKHSVTSSQENLDRSLKKSQTKSPAKQTNSMLNYLKKR